MVNTIFQLEDHYPCDLRDAGKFGELDSREEIERLKVETSDDLTSVMPDESKPDQVVNIGAQLPFSIKTQLTSFLREFKDVFVWTHADEIERLKVETSDNLTSLMLANPNLTIL